MAFPERPEPMNVITHHSKVKVSIAVPDPTFVGGKYASGKMELECRADKGLGIGVIMIELFGIQELSSRDHSATCTFLHAQRLFQGPGLPPSNAVQAHTEPGDPPLPTHHYHARRGISTFLFRIPLPISSPSSLNFGGGLATVKYELRASASVYWRGEKRLVTERKVIDVVEGLDDLTFAEYANGSDTTSIAVGENGKLWIQGSIIGGGIITAGESACVEFQVKNHSSKKNTGLTLTLTRRLVLPRVSSVERQPLQISDTLTNVAFRGPEYIIHPGVEGVANLVFDIPKTARGVKGGLYKDEGDDKPRETQSIFEIQCIVSVKMSLGIGSKDLVLDIPVTVVSPLALPDEPMVLPQEQASQVSPVEPFPYSIPSYPDLDAYTLYPVPASSPRPISPLPMFTAYADQSRVWLPPLSQSPFPYQYVSPVNPLYPQIASPPLPLVQYNHPSPRPASALATSLPYSYPDPAISGLPPTATHHPLLPLLAAHHESILTQHPDLNHLEPEEGKGERASRVAHRLHMSSRHRSVSPRSHRFPLPQSSPGGVNATTDVSVHARDLPPPPPPPVFIPVETSDLSPTPGVGPFEQVTSSPPLYSPRPLPSPKISNTSLPRSERVEEPERIAAEAEDEVAQKSSKTKRKRNKKKGKQRKMADSPSEINKTLPPPPVPTCKGYLSPVSDLFDLERSESEQGISKPSKIPPTPIPAPADKAPPTPTLTAVTPVRHVRSNLTEKLAAGKMEKMESGLDALERRLLAEVGTQKMERRLFSSTADARNIFAGPSTARVVQADAVSPSKVSSTRDASQPTKGRLSPIKIPAFRIGGDIGSEGLNIDSAISSLTLADGGWAMEADRRAREDKEVEQGQDYVVEEVAHETHEERDSDERTHRAGTVGRKSKSKSSFSGDDGREERKEKKKKHIRQVADNYLVDSELEDEAESRGRSREGSMKGKKGGKKKVCHKRRKSVQGRVTAWLDTIDPDSVPPDDFVGTSHMDLGVAVQRSEAMDRDAHESEHERTGANLHRLPLSHVEPVQVDVPTSSPNPRSSGFMPITPEKRETRRTAHHMMTTSDRRQSNVNHELKKIFTPLTCSDASAPALDMKGDTILRISPSSPQLRPMSTSVDRGYEPSLEGSKNRLDTVKVPVNDLFNALTTTESESRDITIMPCKSSAQPLLRVPALGPTKKGQDAEVKYDIRSARGGRGGQVTAIAAFWASAAANEAGPSKPVKGPSAPTVVAPKPVKAQRVNKPFNANERLTDQPPKTATTAKPLLADTNKTSSSVAVAESSPKLLNLAGKTKPVTKSPSVPAVVSSSLATPMLSSTASLARPPTQLPRRPMVTPIVPIVEPSKSHGPTKAKSTTDLAFGKARLRDLIKKYQEQGS